jgi:hypothetical protein
VSLIGLTDVSNVRIELEHGIVGHALVSGHAPQAHALTKGREESSTGIEVKAVHYLYYSKLEACRQAEMLYYRKEMRKRGRPKLKRKEFKKPFPMRFSELELSAFKDTAGEVPIRDWIRETLMAAVPLKTRAKVGILALINEATKTGSATFSLKGADSAETTSRQEK